MIHIVGAGLVGSLWAVLLRKRGFDVTLLERRADPRKSHLEAGRSINLVVTSRGLHALEQADLQAAVRKISVPVYGRMIHPKTGDCLYQAYGQSNEFNLSISRGELNCFLISEAEKAGARILFEADFTQIDPQQKKITYKSPSGLQTSSYEVLFGADGAGSRLRKALAEKYKIHERTEWLEADYKELGLPLKENQPALKTDALHIWPRGAHMLMALANRDGSFTTTLYLPKISAPGREWSFDRAKTPAQVEELFRTEFPDAIALMPNYQKEFAENPQGHLGTVRCSQWVFENSIALMGDAAHAILPFFGQGMNSGFEDCTVLYQEILKNPKDWGAALAAYEKTQKPNATAIADMALENWVEMRDKVGDKNFLLRKKIEGLLEQKYPGRFKSRYGLITYTLTSYSLAQRAGLCQAKIMDELTRSISSVEEVDWNLAEQLLDRHWFPFLKEQDLEIRNYEG